MWILANDNEIVGVSAASLDGGKGIQDVLVPKLLELKGFRARQSNNRGQLLLYYFV